VVLGWIFKYSGMLRTVDLALGGVWLEVVASIFSVKHCKKIKLLDPAKKTLGYYETSVTIYQSTWRHIHLEHHHCDNLKSRSSEILAYGSTDPVGLGLLIVGVSGSHSDTSHAVGLLWTSDRPFAETPTWQHRQTCMTPRRVSNSLSLQASVRRPTS
jgi:hypothetical protein